MSVNRFKLGRWQIPQRRVKPFLIVNAFNKCPDALCRFCQVPILAQIHLFVFERFHKAFGFGIVIGIAHTTHADLDAPLTQKFCVFGSRILNASVGMMHQA